MGFGMQYIRLAALALATLGALVMGPTPASQGTPFTSLSPFLLAEPDTDGDGYPDTIDGCPTIATVWPTPLGDEDCDGWSSADEGFIGTEAQDNCPDDTTDICWPPDFDMNQVINISDLFQVLPPYFGSSLGNPIYSERRDLMPDSVINIADLFKVLPPYFGQTCTSAWKPNTDTTWQWQLSSVPSQQDIIDYPAEVYDIDGFDADSNDVDLIHDNGAMAVCYLSAGTAEDWRSDFDDLHPDYTGNESEEWGGEWFIDYTNPEVLDVMEARIEMCAEKGFDAVEWDNVDIYGYPTGTTGLSLSYSDQLEYNTWLANQTHARGMSVALKNDADQVDDLVGLFDFAIVEECHEYEECGSYSPFIESDKAVFACEYESFDCEDVDQWGFVFIRKHKALDAWRIACW